MFSDIGLSLSGFIYLLLIALLYLVKGKVNELESKLFRTMLFITLGFIAYEIAYFILSFKLQGQDSIIIDILSNAYYILFMAVFYVYYLYLKMKFGNVSYQDFKSMFNDKLTVGGLVFTILCMISVLILDTKSSVGTGSDIGTVIYPFSAFLGVALIACFLLLRHRIKSINKMEKMPLIMLIIFYSCALLFQLFITFIVLSFLLSLVMTIIYLTVESHDYMLVSELGVAKAEADKADKEKNYFMTNMSHEIRTPMNTIIGLTDNLMNQGNPPKDDIINDIHTVYNAGEGLLEVINNVLMYSKIDGGMEEVTSVDYNIKEVLNEVNNYVSVMLNSKTTGYSMELDEDVPLYYKGDKIKIYRILVNLLDYSMKCTSEGNINFSISCDKYDDVLCKITFLIRSSGSVLLSENVTKLFGGEDNIAVSDDGISLGLVLSKKISNLIDGHIEYIVGENGGFLFRFTINQNVSRNAALVDESGVDGVVHYFDCSKYKVLIAEDNGVNLKVILKLLKFYNIQTDTASNGFDCIKKVKDGNKYDLILLDHMMPGMDGIETIRELKRLSIKLPPVIAMSANVVTEVKDLYLKEGFDDFLPKPVDIKVLNKFMKKYFEKDGLR